ncbi:MAG: excinuclease ABC subunit A [Cognaticolwellia sp.]|jgi:excinuclease ABC subunit A
MNDKPIPTDRIQVVGARVHNLKGVDLDLPRDSLVVFTGLSGSGKSSLAFDTIYQEGQRRFMESLSSYARQFLGKMEKPPVDRVSGLSPTISIDQKTVNRNPRSTVGTVTEILDHLRLLVARLGTPHCPECDTPITSLSPGQIVNSLLELPVNTRLVLLAPLVQDRKGEYRKELSDLREAGWVRARIDGEVRRLDQDIVLARYEKHSIELVLDRLKVNPESRLRMVEGVERGLTLSKGLISALVEGKEEEVLHFSSDRGCPNHPQVNIPELEPRLFSFNAAQGACSMCSGLGELVGFEPDRMVDPRAKLPECFRVFGSSDKIAFSSITKEVLLEAAKHAGADLRKTWAKQSPDVQDALLLGEGIDFTYTTVIDRGNRTDKRTRQWSGVAPAVEHVYHFTKHGPFDQFRVRVACPSCDGQRLNPIALGVRFREKNIGQLSSATVGDALAFFQTVELQGSEKLVGKEVLREIQDRLQFLDDVGLGYLSLNRGSTTLSGGEAQRIRLAAQVGSGLQGVTYVLDEPSIGLHARDNQRLLKTLLRLRDQGNSVLVVEHDRETMEVSDYVVDVGPGAGVLGGQVVAQGHPSTLAGKDSSTARYLHGLDSLPLPAERRPGNGHAIGIVNARGNNLKGVSVSIPLGTMTCVTGVSGSGKSTLIVQTLERVLTRHFYPTAKGAGPCDHDEIQGLEHIDKVIVIDQQPIGRTPRSNPATYTKAFDHIRKLFSALPESKVRGYKPGRFSFNVAGGRCEECQGAGVQTIEMQFLADVQVECEACGGKRFNEETLEVRYRGKNITEILAMSITDAAEFFSSHRGLARTLDTLVSVGLGYVAMGQPSTTLSGGEAQRIKLASELRRPGTGKTLYILDEPTTGLHFKDVVRLNQALQRLVEKGNTVLIIEHDLDLIKVCDYVLDMGPEGGNAGGRLVGSGTPEHIATLDTPTGRVLAALPDFGGPPTQFKPKRAKRTAQQSDLVLTGASCHNLKSIDVRIPQGSFTVVTGPSGSGKSSLAFHTIFAEGQRRYVECMSTYARRFLGRLDRAPVEKIEGLAPAIAINQKRAGRNPRSTVATVTEIYDYLRLLFARIGEPHCPHCGKDVLGFSPSQGARALQREGGRGWLCAQLPPFEAAEEARTGLRQEGFLRLLKGQEEVLLEDQESAELLAQGATLVIDRVAPEKAPRSRLSEALQSAYARAQGRALYRQKNGQDLLLTERPTCPDHGPVLPPELTPRHFSFNSWVGACTTCDGLGVATGVDPALLMPKPHLALWAALDPRVASVLKRSKKQRGRIQALLKELGLKLGDRVETYSEKQVDALLYGLTGVELTATWTKQWGKTKNRVVETFEWEGVNTILDAWTSDVSWLRREGICPKCKGGKLRPEILSITIQGKSITQTTELTVIEALAFWQGLELGAADEQVAEQPLREVSGRLQFMMDVGLGYLSLDRAARTLSGGESQRIRLATQLGSGLTGCIYVLDEPTVGLHPRDTQRLLGTLQGLKSLGNTVLVVEHDAETILQADFVLDMGPGAGEAGGSIMAQGSPAELMANPASLTGRYLSGALAIPQPEHRRTQARVMKIQGAYANNLHQVDASFPLGCLTVVTGVSGSGKSSLVMECLVPAILAKKSKSASPAPVAKANIPSNLAKVVVVDQRPLSGSPRSTPATTTKMMDRIRKLYATTGVSKVNGWGPGRFSYNAATGRCPHCEGRGFTLVEMHFLSDVWVLCEQCRGKRYNAATLSAKWKGLSIADVLELRVEQALEFFSAHRSLRRVLQAMQDVGLGYLKLGQSVTTLSGGESQRLKLARELSGKTEDVVYVLDEPTTGLHMDDVAKLVVVLQTMVDAGATLIVIEHHPELIANADYIIDVGPEGGSGGGHIVATGTPEQVAQQDTPTGQAIAPLF